VARPRCRFTVDGCAARAVCSRTRELTSMRFAIHRMSRSWNLSSPLQGVDVSFDRQDARSLQGPQCLLPQRRTSNDSSGLRRSTVIGMQPRKRTPLSESTFSASCAMHADAALSLPKPARAPQPTPASHASLCFCKPASVHGVPHVEVGNPLVGRSRSKQCCLAKITSDKL